MRHVHGDSYFPFRDSLYAGTFDLSLFTSLLQVAAHDGSDRGTRHDIVVIDEREEYRIENVARGRGENPNRPRFRNWLGAGADPKSAVDHGVAAMASQLFQPSHRVVFGEPITATSYDVETRVLSNGAGWSLSVYRAGDRDFYYEVGTVYLHGQKVANLAIHTTDCWRPDYGPCWLINLNRAYLGTKVGPDCQEIGSDDLPFEIVAPLLNMHPSLFVARRHLGSAVLVDSRSAPANYYYG